MKKLLALLVVAGVLTVTFGCGTETKPTKAGDKATPAAPDKPKDDKPK